MNTFKKDLAAANIPFEDMRGRRGDIHSLWKTFGTMLAASGVSTRVAMEMMRHSDMKLTMEAYTDASQLPIIQETARLPSFRLPALATALPAANAKQEMAQGDAPIPKNSLASPLGASPGAHNGAHNGVQNPASSPHFESIGISMPKFLVS